MLMKEVTHDRRALNRTLIVSYSGAPDGPQRELLTRQIDDKPDRTCVMTKSAIVRAVTSALLFFNPTMKVIDLHEKKQTYDFLDLSTVERETADRVCDELKTEIDIKVTNN